MSESARPASRRDLARLVELWDSAGAELGLQRGGARLVAGTTPLDGLDGTDPDRLVVVGCIDEFVAGFAVAVVDRAPDPPVAVVEAIYVEPAARGVGVGEAMMDKLMAWAGDRGAGGLDAFALPGARAAKAFFEDSGFVTRLLTMHRRLPAARPPAGVRADAGPGALPHPGVLPHPDASEYG